MTSLSLCHAPRPAGATRAAGRHRKPVLQAQLRLATEDDRPALLELHRCALLALVRGHYTAAQVRSLLRHSRTLDPALIADRTYSVAELDDRIVACGGWSLAAPGDPDTGEFGAPQAGDARAPLIRAMYTRPSYERRGLGRQVLAAAERAASCHGDQPIELDATLAGVPLYLSAGYEPIGESDWRMPDGERIALVRMRKRHLPRKPGLSPV